MLCWARLGGAVSRHSDHRHHPGLDWGLLPPRPAPAMPDMLSPCHCTRNHVDLSNPRWGRQDEQQCTVGLDHSRRLELSCTSPHAQESNGPGTIVDGPDHCGR
jgi:hypothetical protein